jgi:hypothetical protein
MRVKAKSKWLAAGAVAIAAAALLFHSPLLRCLAGLLIADEPVGDCQYVGVLEWYGRPDGDRCYDVAAELCRSRPSRGLLLVESGRSRLVEMGVLPSFEAISRRELKTRGPLPQTVSVIASDGFDDWAKARALRAWLADRPSGSVVLLCGAFRSAHLRYVLDAVLDPTQAARSRVRPLPDRRFDETNWWTSRDGIKAFGFAWLRQLHGWFAGGDHLPPSSCRVDEYENRVRQALLLGKKQVAELP